MPPRTWEWFRRVRFPDCLVPLDFGKELWKCDLSRYESVDAIIAAAKRADRPFDDDSVLYQATSSLLFDVVDAAGGVEYANVRLHECIERAHNTYTSLFTAHGEAPGPHYMINMEEAWYTVEELVVWARTLDDRLKRDGGKERPDQGLIPALADGPRREAVITARSRLLASGLQEARWLSGLNLHMQSTQAGSKVGRIENGQVILPFPDQITERINHRWELTYSDGRDAVSFADALMESVATFMDAMLAAFQKNLPERFRNP
jgi:hypothetical protein